ncbi:MAG: class I SAM-dependent RNA methyltransferase [Deltaproteobacteria bacterium]|nr:class I SAM-dependent RNA methyltransferase [Deltaproteobacteria bacterium]
MSMFQQQKDILVTCPVGIASYLASEIEEMGYPVRSATARAVGTAGTLVDAMKMNLMLRTAHRVLYLLDRFKADGPDQLHRRLSGFPWEKVMERNGYFSVLAAADTPSITDSRFAALTCKDAIVDRFRRTGGIRPDSGPRRDKTVFFCHWRDSDASIYADTSGTPLARRGYRKIPLTAPLQESLAAALIAASHWNEEGVFVNPMCGSGTLAIEAALISLRKAPGLLRENFGFMHLKGFDGKAWTALRKSAAAASKTKPLRPIIATDESAEALEAAKMNARAAGVEHAIDFIQCDFIDTPLPPPPGIVIMNPAYGERMGHEAELEGDYRRIGDFLKKQCSGYWGYVFTGNAALSKHIGLQTKRRLTFMNGAIECRLLEYELYAGSKKNQTFNLNLPRRIFKLRAIRR